MRCVYSRLWYSYYNTFHGYTSNNQECITVSDSTRTLLSYKDICKNGLYIVTHEDNNEESLPVTKTNGDGYDILDRIPNLPSGLYYTYIKLVPHVVYKVIFRMLIHSKSGMIGWGILV
jgi:hypothetical protein